MSCFRNPLLLMYTSMYIFSKVSAEPTSPRQYTFNTNLLTWNEAKANCHSSQELLAKIESPTTDAMIKEIVFHLEQQDILSTDMWFGMFDKAPTSIKYEWPDCGGVGSWFNWYPDEPDNQDKEFCIRYTRAGFWRTKACDKLYHFICEKQLDTCWFDTVTRASLLGNLTVFPNSTTLEDCRSECLNHNETEAECTAVTSHQDGRCAMTIGEKPHVFYFPEMMSDDSSTTSIKRCVAYYVSDHSIDYVNTEITPNGTCIPSSPALPTAHRGINITLPECPESDAGSYSSTSSSTPSSNPSSTASSTPSSTLSSSQSSTASSTKSVERNDIGDFTLDKKTLSSYRRRLTSVYEGRISAVALGSTGIGVICAVIGLLICTDLNNMIRSAEQVIYGGSRQVK